MTIHFRSHGGIQNLYTPKLTSQAQQKALQATQISAQQVQAVMQNLVQGQPGNQTDVNNFLAEQIAELGIAVSKNTVALREILGSLRLQ